MEGYGDKTYSTPRRQSCVVWSEGVREMAWCEATRRLYSRKGQNKTQLRCFDHIFVPKSVSKYTNTKYANAKWRVCLPKRSCRPFVTRRVYPKRILSRVMGSFLEHVSSKKTAKSTAPGLFLRDTSSQKGTGINHTATCRLHSRKGRNKHNCAVLAI